MAVSSREVRAIRWMTPGDELGGDSGRSQLTKEAVKSAPVASVEASLAKKTMAQRMEVVVHVPGSTEVHKGRGNDGAWVARSQDNMVVVGLLGAPYSSGLDSGDRMRDGVASHNGGAEWR
jgi:hypothetical protein